MSYGSVKGRQESVSFLDGELQISFPDFSLRRLRLTANEVRTLGPRLTKIVSSLVSGHWLFIIHEAGRVAMHAVAEPE